MKIQTVYIFSLALLKGRNETKAVDIFNRNYRFAADIRYMYILRLCCGLDKFIRPVLVCFEPHNVWLGLVKFAERAEKLNLKERCFATLGLYATWFSLWFLFTLFKHNLCFLLFFVFNLQKDKGINNFLGCPDLFFSFFKMAFIAPISLTQGR